MAIPDSLKEQPCQWCGSTTGGFMDRHLPTCPYPARIEALIREIHSRLRDRTRDESI